MNPSNGFDLFGVHISFDRGRLLFSWEFDKIKMCTFMILLPWAYYDPNEYDGFAGYNKTFKIHADTELAVSRDPEIDFWYFKLAVLGLGASFTYQGSY